MTTRSAAICSMALFLLVAACDDTDEGEGETSGAVTTSATEGTSDQVPPTDASLLAWLEGENYLGWEVESAIHPGAGPHFGNVRTWVNDAAIAGLEGRSGELDVGAATVKELYGDGQERRGWSVSVKTTAGAGGDGWYWYEVYDGSELANDQGLGVCVGCHGGGTDFVLTPFPLQ